MNAIMKTIQKQHHEPSSRQFIDLASETEWKFTPIGGTMGSVPYPIRVPGGGWYNQGFDSDSGIYERWLDIPDTGVPQIVILEFEAINFQSDIYFGKDPFHLRKIASAYSSWMPVKLDITKYVNPGSRYFISIFVKGREACSILTGNCKEYTVPEGANWTLTMDSGILRGVFLALYPIIFIEDLFVRTSAKNHSLEADLWIWNGSAEDADIDLALEFESPQTIRFQYPQIDVSKHCLKAGEKKKITIGNIKWELGKASYWWPNLPYRENYRTVLHFLHGRILQNGQILDAASVRFGFREFEYRGCDYYLNGVKIRLRGHNQTEADFNGGTNHSNDAYGTWPGFQQPSLENGGWPKAVDNYLRLNANVLRFHQIPCTRYMLDVCDEQGLMVIMESSVRGDDIKWTYQYENMKLIREAACVQIREMVKRDRNHPSVIIWSVANEPWIGKKYNVNIIYEYNNVVREQDGTRVRMVDGAIKAMEGDIVPVKHYWYNKPIFEWADKPNGHGEYGSLCDETDIKNTAEMTKKYRMDPRIADLRPWHMTYVWTSLVPGVRIKDVYIENSSRVYRKISTEKMASMLKENKFTQNLINCKAIGKEEKLYAFLDADEPWQHPIIKLLCNAFHPLAAFDIKQNREIAGRKMRRTIRVFNDTLKNEDILFEWECRMKDTCGRLIARGKESLTIHAGEYRDCLVKTSVPAARDPLNSVVCLLLRTSVQGKQEFEEAQYYKIV